MKTIILLFFVTMSAACNANPPAKSSNNADPDAGNISDTPLSVECLPIEVLVDGACERRPVIAISAESRVFEDLPSFDIFSISTQRADDDFSPDVLLFEDENCATFEVFSFDTPSDLDAGSVTIEAPERDFVFRVGTDVFYDVDDRPTSLSWFEPGFVAPITAEGGEDFPEFSSSIESFPPPEGLTVGGFIEAEDFSLQWVPRAADYVVVWVTAVEADRRIRVSCRTDDDGEFVVPGEAFGPFEFDSLEEVNVTLNQRWRSSEELSNGSILVVNSTGSDRRVIFP